MPKRVLDFDAMWGSDKLAACAAWAQAEYAWMYGLADASGCFELTNLRVIWGRVAAVRGDFTIERLEQVFAEFQDKGLLFVWEHQGKRYAHWTGSDVPGRLPPPSWRMRLERFAPPVPKQQLAEYMARFARGRAALAGVGFRGEEQSESCNRKGDYKFEISDLKEEREQTGPAQGSLWSEQTVSVADFSEDRAEQDFGLKGNGRAGGGRADLQIAEGRTALNGRDGISRRCRENATGSPHKECLEEGQAQDLDLDGNLKKKWEMEPDVSRGAPGEFRVRSGNGSAEKEINKTDLCNSSSNSKAPIDENSTANKRAGSSVELACNSQLDPNAEGRANSNLNARTPTPVNPQTVRSPASFGWREKDLALARELRLGQGPVCGPAGVRPEILERVRKREAARAGSRSP
jgi:hypothetical protein